MFAATTSLLSQVGACGTDSSTDCLQWMGKIVDPTTDKSLAEVTEPKDKILFAQTDQQLWAKVKLLRSSVLPHFIY